MDSTEPSVSAIQFSFSIVFAYIAAIALIVAAMGVLLVAFPLGVLWSLNALFGLGVPITFKTLAATLFLCWAARDTFVPRPR